MPFNPQLSEPRTQGRSARGSFVAPQAKSGAEIAIDALQAGAETLGPIIQKRRKQQQIAETNEAFVDFQNKVIDQENELIQHRAATAQNIQNLADLQTQARRTVLDDEGIQQMTELQTRRQKLNEARQEGGLTEAGFRIRQNLLRKRALNDPRLAGMQDEIDKVFDRHPGDFDPLDDVLSDADRQRLGPVPRPGQVTALINEKRLQADMNKALQMGEMSVNNIDQNLRPQVFMEGRKVYETALNIVNDQGAIDPTQMTGLRQQFNQIRNDAVAEAYRSFERADNQGMTITREQREAVIDGINKDVDDQMEFLEGKDLKTKITNLNKLEEEAMKQALPLAMRSMVGAASGSPGDITTMLNLMNMPDSQIKALAGKDNEEFADIITMSADQRLRAASAMMRGVNVPGTARLRSYISANMLRNGTTEEGTKLGLGNLFEGADNSQNLGQTFEFLAEDDVAANIKGSEAGMAELQRRVKAGVLTIKQQQSGNTRTIVENGRLKIVPTSQQAADNPNVQANIQIDQMTARSLNKVLDKYTELDGNKLLAEFDTPEDVPEPSARRPGGRTMQELREENREKQGESDQEEDMFLRFIRRIANSQEDFNELAERARKQEER